MVRTYWAGSSTRICSMAATPFAMKSACSASVKASESLLREPLGRPAGLPLSPGLKGRPRGCFPAVLSALIGAFRLRLHIHRRISIERPSPTPIVTTTNSRRAGVMEPGRGTNAIAGLRRPIGDPIQPPWSRRQSALCGKRPQPNLTLPDLFVRQAEVHRAEDRLVRHPFAADAAEIALQSHPTPLPPYGRMRV